MLRIYLLLVLIVMFIIVFEKLLKGFGCCLSILITFLIVCQLPREEIGLVSLPASDIFGTPSSAQRKLRQFTNFCILLYLIIALWIDLFF